MSPELIVLIIVGAVLLVIILLLIAINVFYNKIFSRRGDGSNSIIYDHPSDYPSLNKRHGFLLTRDNYHLSYYIYKKEGVKIKATLVVCHGIGFGHLYLLPMINKFCEDGYLVFAYDQFSSGASEGKGIKSMTTGIKDIPYVLKFVKEDKELNKYPLYVFGHSWGGFVAFFYPRYSNDIQKCVSISGFTHEGSLAPKFAFFIRLRNLFLFGKDAFYDNRKSIKKSNTKFLYIQGVNDSVVNPRFAGKKYAKLQQKHDNIDVKMLENKGHTPYNDDHSQAEQDKVLGEFGLLGGVLVPIEHYIDFRKISKVDENVYKLIIDFYNS